MKFKAYYSDNRTYITHTDPRLARIISLAVVSRPSCVLDVGCGNGYLLDCLSQKLEAKLAGVDVYEQKSKNWDYKAADITEGLPFEAELFDLVICGEVIEHVPDPDALLAEIRRVLKPAGKVIVSTPNLAAWANRIMLPLGFQPLFTETSTRVNLGRRFRVLGQGGKVQGHLKVFTSSSLRELMTLSGFRVSRVYGAPFFFPRPISFIDKAFTFIPSLASNTIVLGEKVTHQRAE